MDFKIVSFLITYAIVLFSISVHEAAHAWTANKLGDPTAKMMGRVTLNPIPHFSVVGMVVMPLLLYLAGFMPLGYAKPVLVDLRNVKNPKRDNALIAIAGPASNILTAIIFIALFAVLKHNMSGFSQFHPLVQILMSLILINMILALFNLIPIPPLDGSSVMEGILTGPLLKAYRNFAMWTRAYFFYIIVGILLLDRFMHINVLSYIFSPAFDLINYILNAV